MVALVKNGWSAVQKIAPPGPLSIVGLRVRLRPELDKVHVVYFCGGRYIQRLLEKKKGYIYDLLHEGMIVEGEEALEEPVTAVDSIGKEDCYMTYRFNLRIEDCMRAFPAWQFEPVFR